MTVTSKPPFSNFDEPYESAWRTASKGRCFVYLLPCRDADEMKVGFARDPLQRFRSLHSRFYRFFDLKRGVLIETEHVADARAIETRLKKTAAGYGHPAPLQVKSAAGGRTEWYRGASLLLSDEALIIADSLGFAHLTVEEWVRRRLEQWDGLFDWSHAMLQRIIYLQENGGQLALPSQVRSLVDTVDLFEGMGFELEGRMPQDVLAWIAQRR